MYIVYIYIYIYIFGARAGRRGHRAAPSLLSCLSLRVPPSVI